MFFTMEMAYLLLICLFTSSFVSVTSFESKVSNYIIHTDTQSRPLHLPTQKDWYSSMIDDIVTNDLAESRIFYMYDTVLDGFAARLTPKEAESFAKMPGVVDITKEEAMFKLDTTRSPQFLGLNENYGLWPDTNFGDNVIIGIIDGGIWPESDSFKDTGLGPIPSKWKGLCEEGQDFNSSNCNKKLIGARFLLKGISQYKKSNEHEDDEKYYLSPRDEDGHGTHIASTAAGAVVKNANIFGFANGTARGVATKARIAAYKVCLGDSCAPSDLLAGIEKAIQDGVDVLSISIGYIDDHYYKDIIAKGAFAALRRNVFVACSAGNEGPGFGWVHNAAPWITTVGSGSMDRSFPLRIKIGKRVYEGSSLYPGKITLGKQFPLVDLKYCDFEKKFPTNITGKIIVCRSSNTNPIMYGRVIHKGRGAGVIELNDNFFGEDVCATTYTIPAVRVGYLEGLEILAYMNSTSNPVASFLAHNFTNIGHDRAPIVAGTSSRGPSQLAPEILKPDLIAPGVNILAAWPHNLAPTRLPNDPRRVKFNLDSGTSMATPHVAGVAALLRAAHPDWSPSAIRSALMTTASMVDNQGRSIVTSENMTLATPLSMGAGHVNPQLASDPGLIYEIGAHDYIKFICTFNYTEKQMRAFGAGRNACSSSTISRYDLNYPSFSVIFKPNIQLVKFRRTVTSVGEIYPEIFKAQVVNNGPRKVKVSIKPRTMIFERSNEKKSYTVTFKSEFLENKKTKPAKEMGYGSISWESDRHRVRSPFSVMW